jgi:hypothetical protein
MKMDRQLELFEPAKRIMPAKPDIPSGSGRATSERVESNRCG